MSTFSFFPKLEMKNNGRSNGPGDESGPGGGC